ncbi:MAG TPA: hypothetical protein VIG33_13905 [Pseudobdellovibrionaceae bacterium]|jgi:hypothetical protein
MEPKVMNRRQVLGLSSASLLMLVFGAKAKAHQGDTAELTQDFLKIESGPGQIVNNSFAHHHHYLEIPLQYIQEPPAAGLQIHTGWAIFRNKFANFAPHFHTVPISQQELEAVGRGETVIVEDTVKDHKYVLTLSSSITSWHHPERHRS